MEVGVIELVGVAAGSGTLSTIATVAAMRADMKNLKDRVADLARAVQRATDLAIEARHEVRLLEVRR